MFWTVFAQLHLFSCKYVFIAPTFLLMHCYGQLWDYLHLPGLFFVILTCYGRWWPCHIVTEQSFTAFSKTQMQTCTKWLYSAAVLSSDNRSFFSAAGKLAGRNHCWNCYLFCLQSSPWLAEQSEMVVNTFRMLPVSQQWWIMRCWKRICGNFWVWPQFAKLQLLPGGYFRICYSTPREKLCNTVSWQARNQRSLG